ncbi:nucleotide exchange factor GrpE [Aerococcus agrisoli]|uniref:Protein GrpE n=1 Tax=Aerococcus agrisoli TaxID=2487350 RepID=A0A3N4GJY8_9LACT|nr:nucleotide exchange factor GrpE [Aerococcus agrisoli]RPA62485.1 nucleotide exchange factor GrpE [Aerococcus agrisoli]
MDDNQQDLHVDEEVNETEVQEETESTTETTETSELEALKAELASKEDQIIRLSAEIQNINRRNQTEREASAKYRSQNLAKAILPAVDNLERALDIEVDDDASNSIHKGIEMVHASLLQAFAEEGIEVIDPKGEIFDPNFHQSVSAVPAEEGQQADEIVQVYQKGYKLNDRVLRPAMVIIAQ